MKFALVAAAALLSAPAWAADVKTNLIDHSNSSLIDEAAAKAVWKIHPAKRFAFLSQVEGGLNTSGTCVVAARVMVLPLTATVGAPLFRPLPKLTATAYDAVASSTTDKCKAMAKDKLKEATLAVVSTIVKL
jgi:hypothetical protein